MSKVVIFEIQIEDILQGGMLVSWITDYLGDRNIRIRNWRNWLKAHG
jgi:hypothetical protein